jgi:hypothetical protein
MEAQAMMKKALYRFWKKIRPYGKDQFEHTSIAPLLSLGTGKDDMVVAEIGVFKADSSVAMLKSWRIRKFYAIDPWATYADYLASEESVTTRAVRERDGAAVFEEVKKRLRDSDNVVLLRKFSTMAAPEFGDGEETRLLLYR